MKRDPNIGKPGKQDTNLNVEINSKNVKEQDIDKVQFFHTNKDKKLCVVLAVISNGKTDCGHCSRADLSWFETVPPFVRFLMSGWLLLEGWLAANVANTSWRE